MMYRTLRAIFPLLILAGGIGGLLALGSREQETRQPSPPDLVPALRTAPVQPQDGGWELEFDGSVQPFREVEVGAEVAGRVRFKADECKAGYFVRQGTLLIEVDPADYQLEVQRYEKQLEQAESELQENSVESNNIIALLALAERDLKLGRAELERMTELSGRDATSKSELDRAERSALTAEQALQSLHNQLQSSGARRKRLEAGVELASSLLERARLELGRTKIAAPLDGVIVRDWVEQDGYLQKGQRLFTIEDTSRVEVHCSLRMDQLYWLWGQRASQGLAASVEQAYQIPRTEATIIAQIVGLPDVRFSWRGTLARYDGIGVDERTRTIPCRILVDHPREVSVVTADGCPVDSSVAPPALVRGMYVAVRLHVQPSTQFVLVPEDAIAPGKFVWCVRDGRLIRLGPLSLIRRIEPHDQGGSVGNYWLAPTAANGLSLADELVVSPIGGLQEGARVGAATGDRQRTLDWTAN